MSEHRSYARESLRLYTRASWLHRRHALLSILSPVGAMLTNVGVPYYAGQALGSIANYGSNFSGRLILLVAVSVAGILANRIGFVNLMRLQAETMNDLNTHVFERLMDRSVGFHTNQISGKLISDALDFVTSYSVLLMAVMTNGVSLAAIVLSGLIVVAINSWQLGLFLLSVVLITLTWAYFESKTRGELRNIRLVASKRLTGHLSDSIVNAQTVKMFAAEQLEITKNHQLNHNLLNLRVKDWYKAGVSGNNRAAALLGMLILLIVLIRHVSQTNPDVLAIGIFAFTYTFTLLIRLFDINGLTRQIEESILQAAPMTQILLEPTEIIDQPLATELTVSQGLVEFNNVQFQYIEKQSKQAVFEGLSLTVKPGEKVGLVGPSGGGKTTITRLILRLEDIQSGKISIDGQDIATVKQTSLRHNIGYVPQEPLLFHRSVHENIGYGKPNASHEEIVLAAKLAHADSFIQTLPKGYDTIVGERGIKLSGGQRQRVAIARAILKNAPLLILDEATSALDSENEKFIQAALLELMKGKTALVIAHRLSTIQRMDRIIVLDQGVIIEEGTHATLLKHGGLYAKLWAHQSGGFLED